MLTGALMSYAASTTRSCRRLRSRWTGLASRSIDRVPVSSSSTATSGFAAVAEELAELGIKVVAQLDNGADGVGALVAEQPDLLLVEDALPQVTGMQMLAATRRYAPHTRTAMQVPYDDGLAPALDAGAAAVFTRRTPPADIALQLARLVATS
jgi:DNA-binding NarL/FixJ family response regulator